MRLTSLTLLLVALTGPAFAEDASVTGTIAADGRGGVVLTSGKSVYRVTGDVAPTLLQIASTNPGKTPRTVTVEGEVDGKARIDAKGRLVRSFDAYALDSPRSITAQGVLGKDGANTTLTVDGGSARGKRLRVTGAPAHLLARLAQRRVVVAGWRFGDELQLTSAQARVTKAGWLSRKQQDASGTWRYKTVAEVSEGQPVRVLELAGYDKASKQWKPVSAMKPGDMLFAKVGAGRPRADGEGARTYPFVGWMPVYKLSFGEKVEQPEPEQRTLPAQGKYQGAAKTLPKLGEQKKTKTAAAQ